MPPKRPDYMTIRDFAAYLGVSGRTIYRLFRRGLPSVLVGRSRRVPREHAVAWLGRHTPKRPRPR
jgi:excisionase family DNA binding protein